MPRVINEDEFSQLIETDDGNIVFMPRSAGGIENVQPISPLEPPPQGPLNAPVGPAPEQFQGVLPGNVGAAIAPAVAPTLAPPQTVEAPPAPTPGAAPEPAKPAPALKPGSIQDAFAQNAAGFEAADRATKEGAKVDANIANEQYAIADRGAQVQAGMEQQAQLARNERDKMRVQKQGDADKAATEYEKTTIDEGRRWREASTGKKVLWGISMALSGLGAAIDHKADQPNPVIQMMHDWIAVDVRKQQDARAALGRKAERLGADVSKWEKLSADKDAQFAAQMAGELGKVDQQLKIAAMKYGGDKAMANYMAASADLQRLKGEYIQKYAEGEAGRALQQKQIGLGYANLNEQREQRKEGTRRWEIENGQKIGQDAFDNAIKIAGLKGMPDIAAQKFAAEERDKARALAVGGRAVPVKDAKGNIVDVEYKPLAQKDGSNFLAPTEKDAQDIRGSKTAVDNLLRLTDEIVRLREEHGHEPDFTKSTAWQQMQANWADSVIQAKEMDKLGVLAGPDMSIIGKQLGTSDPTELRNIIPGLRKFRANTLDNFNTKLRAHNYTGERYDIPELSNAGVQARAANTPTLGDVNAANNPNRFDPQAIMSRLNDRFSSPQTIATPGYANQLPAPSQEAAIISLAGRAKSGDAVAVDALRVFANSNPNPRMRDLAKRIAADNGIDIGIGAPALAGAQ